MAERAEEEQGFLQELDRRPKNMDLRLIFADWLEEREDPRTDLVRHLVDFSLGKTREVDVSNPELLWSALRLFAPPRKRLRKLNSFQEHLIPLWESLWMQIGLSTRRTNREKAEAFIRESYRHAGEKEPEHIDWFNSPLGAFRKVTSSVTDSATDYIDWFRRWWPHEKTSADSGLQDRVATIRTRIGEVIGGAVSGRVYDEVLSRMNGAPRDHYFQLQYGAWAAYGLSVHSFFHHVCGLPVHPALRSLFHLALEIGIWFPLKNRAIVSEKPQQLIVERKRLKLITYRNGFRLEPGKATGRVDE